MTRNFATWLSGFRTSIATYGYYIDFSKVYQNIDSIKVELNIMNTLIGHTDIENEFIRLVERYPEVLKCVPLLLAVRNKEIEITDWNGVRLYRFDKVAANPKEYAEFMRKSGLFDLLQRHLINSLVDYATGVETGLDSNGRKNRGGHLMENVVESYLQKAGIEKNDDNAPKTYYPEMYVSDIEKKWGINLSAVSNQGKTEKRFDFVVKTPNMIYGIEANFYAGGGSKLNETARSYKTLALEAANIPGFTFVWFTDGKGWKSARHNLEETFDVLPHLYNIQDMEQDIMSKLFE